ncbi:MAG: IPTL-CTERM sorting domain-containing protein, partial [Chitinophagales bacterium]
IVILNPTNLTAINANGGASVGTLTEPDGNFTPSNGADPIFAYTTSDNTSGGTIDNICSIFIDDVLIGNENPIIDYPNAIVVELNDDQDNAAYNPASGISFPNVTALITNIQDNTNYQLTDGVGDQSIDLAVLYSGLTFTISSGDVPTLSEWGLINLALLLMTFGTLSIVQMKMRSEV